MPAAFFWPKYWPTWIGLGVLRLLEWAPAAWQLRLGTGLGFLIRHLPLAVVRIARRNIELCFPELSSAAVAALLDRHCTSLGLGVCETANTWWRDDERVRRSADICGMEHLTAALARGRGAIMIGGHFTTIEIATRILGTAVPLNMLYKATKNPLLTYIMRRSFAKYGTPIAHDDIRAMVRALRNNEVVWYAPDQSYRNKGAAMVNFFGIPAATTTATSRLARISGAAVLTYFPERLAGAMQYRVVIGPELHVVPGADPSETACRFNTLLESHISRVPDQYFWVHRRFKGLCPDYPNYYGRDSRGAARHAADPLRPRNISG